jgi:pullulanase
VPQVRSNRAGVDLRTQRAHWIDEATIAWDVANRSGRSYALVHDDAADVVLDGSALRGGASIPLRRSARGLTDEQRARFPHIGGFAAFHLPDSADVPALLRQQLIVSASDGDGLHAATGVQLPGVLDARYAAAAAALPLGVRITSGVPTLRLWAPTARSVRLHRFTRPRGGAVTVADLELDRRSGVWSVTGEAAWIGSYYLYEVRVYAPTTGKVETNLVTDPYSVALAERSARSQIADLDAPELVPPGWADLAKPPLAHHADASVYELHVRDFSITDETVPAVDRGTFRAFTHTATAGMRHLRDLAAAGLTHLHLLPVFDIATIEEDPARRAEPDVDVLAALPPDSADQQAIVLATAARDGFNWGYDPLHWTVPEGSYATVRDGAARTRELRELVCSLNGAGLRVVLDVAYNHTHAAGQQETSILDRIVPGYYHRLLEDGTVADSTCCPNTATEHAMMARLMVDSVVSWARDYKADGFRFDLMGHHSKADMLAVRAALDALTPAVDGVDGAAIIVYGEGWNFGEVADDARFEQATQANMAGTGIGTFNDRLRDAVRGGAPFDEDARVQGFGSGLATTPNGVEQRTPEQQRDRLLDLADLVRIGLAGNLADYSFTDRRGVTVRGAEVDYNGAPAGYTAEPHEAVNYVSKHDNETLFDALAMKLPQATSMEDRVRLQQLALATVALGQGMPFFHAGSDLLRSKSLDRNSFESGDWFNRLDWSRASNNFGVGLPPAPDNASRWPAMRPLLADASLRADKTAIERCAALFRELLAIRSSSPLFRLGDAAEVAARLQFANTGPEQIPGVIAMRLSDEGHAQLDVAHRNIVVVWNAASVAHTIAVTGTDDGAYLLHPVQAASVDPTVRTASFAGGGFTVPARTTAVFVEHRSGGPPRAGSEGQGQQQKGPASRAAAPVPTSCCGG